MNNDIIALTALEDSMSVLAKIIDKKTITEEILIQSELTFNQFKTDFHDIIEIDSNKQLWFIKKPYFIR